MSETVIFGKIKDPEIIVLNFRGRLRCRRGGETRRSHRGVSEVLELESSDKGHEGILEDPGVDEELRVRKERVANKTRAGRVTRCDARVPDGEADDFGKE